MKNFLIYLIAISFTLSCSNSSKEERKTQVVLDFPKTEGYYEDSTCDVGHLKSSEKKELVKIKPVKKEGHRSVSSLSDLKDMAGSKACPDLTVQELKDLNRTAEILRGSLEDPHQYQDVPGGFQNYINDVGVIEKFSASEMISPHRPGKAQGCGYERVLLPPQCRWPSGAVQGLVAGKLRAAINNGDPFGPRAITLRNWWRPGCYNKAVGGAGASDHIQARGFDLDFPTPRDRAKAQKWLCELYKREKPFNMQVGIGCQTIHIGLGSPKNLKARFGQDGSRYWTYGSLQRCPLKRLQGDDCWLVKGYQKRIHSDERGYRGGL